MAQKIANRGKIVIAAGTGINLALGVLYTWSIFKGAIKQSIEEGGANAFNWDLAALNDPYAVCCLVFAFTMIIAGRCQDKFGPRITAIIGGALVGAGFVWISQTTSYIHWVMAFGILVGAGIAFGYSSATPAALKWFPPNKTGIIAGIVVSGFGLASVYIAPLAKYLLLNWGLQNAMLFFGIAFFIVVSLLALLLTNPPEGYVPTGFVERRDQSENNVKARAAIAEKNIAPGKMVKTSTFWLLWLLYFIGAGAGLMVIGSVAGMAQKSMGDSAFLAVAILAIGNAGGRIAAGFISDKIGRSLTMAGMFSFQALLMFIAVPIINSTNTSSAVLLVLLATLIGFNYGANLALFPSFAKDLFGIKNFGVNYGILFTAWGVGGFVMSKASQSLMVQTGNYGTSFQAAGILLVIGVCLSFLLSDEKAIQRRALRRLAAQSNAA
ncbi:MAG: OFA family MFS transporter [Proteobacteria bacterium]|nr:OFA family MFS transporter [Pseudomonadota bacterium]MBU1708849.1 OFA family MFS transporter [Pseudomonadota bacterium]